MTKIEYQDKLHTVITHFHNSVYYLMECKIGKQARDCVVNIAEQAQQVQALYQEFSKTYKKEI